MIAGVLRWRNIRGRGGIWWVLYTQASLHHLADSGAQVQFKKSPAPSYGGYLVEGTYNLNGGVVEVAPPGAASVSV